MDCPICRKNEQSNPITFQFGRIDSIPGEVEHVPPPSKFPTHAECSSDPDHFFIVEVDEEEDRLTMILDAQAPEEDETYDFSLSDLEIELT